MQTKRFIAVILLSNLLLQVACANVKRSLEVEVTVSNAEGLPLEGAEFKAIFWGGLPKDDRIVKVLTDAEGAAQLSGRTEFNTNFFFTKEGYYATEMEKYKWERPDEFLDRSVEIDLDVELKAIKDPQPLIARKKTYIFPIAETWLGFDLEHSDWVKPYGEGKTTDLLLYYEKEFLGYRTSEEGLEKVRARRNRTNQAWTEEMAKEIYGTWRGSLKIKFPGEDDGILEVESAYDRYSNMRMPYEAPAEGYEGAIEWIDASTNEHKPPEAKGYFMRLRVKKEGEDVVAANYAKINEGILFNPGRNRLTLNYCFNPEVNDRNLEFDPKANLLELENVLERVHLP